MNWKKGINPMSDYCIRLTETARDDIADIGDYITYHLLSPDISYYFIKGLRNSISNLKVFPYNYPIIKESIFEQKEIRCMPYKNYLVFYEIIENMKTIHILRVSYGKQNWKEELKL